METLKLEYHLRVPSGDRKAFQLQFVAATMQPVDASEQVEAGPDWARLSCHTCPDCKLDAKADFCPAALRQADLMAWAAGLDSFTPVQLVVKGPERIVMADTTAQRAISSLMGLLMATSGCPDMAFLRPMARFHLPLADAMETAYRAVSMHLLAQYFLRQSGKNGEDGLETLRLHYRRLQKVNRSLCDRLRQAISTDSGANAIIILDCYARYVPDMIEEALNELSALFAEYPSAS